MKNREAVNILFALQRISGKPAQPDQPVAKLKFNGPAIYAIARNIRKLTEIKADLDASQNLIVKAVLKDGENGIPAGDKRAQAVIDELGKMYDQESEYVPFKIRLEDLRLDLNQDFSPDDLAFLFPILDEDPPATPKPSAGGVQ